MGTSLFWMDALEGELLCVLPRRVFTGDGTGEGDLECDPPRLWMGTYRAEGEDEVEWAASVEDARGMATGVDIVKSVWMYARS